MKSIWQTGLPERIIKWVGSYWLLKVFWLWVWF